MVATQKPVRRNIAVVVSLVAGIIPWLVWLIWFIFNLSFDLSFYESYPDLSTVLTFIFFLAPPAAAFIAIVSGIIALVKRKNSSTVQIIIAILGLCLGILSAIAFLPAFMILAMSSPWYM